MKHSLLVVLAMVGTLALGSPANAADADKLAKQFDCNTVRFGQPPWTGVKVKTATATRLLELLGYDTTTKTASLGISYKAMAGGDIDTMLSQWFPSARNLFRPFGIKGSLDIISPNLTGGTYTIAVPTYVYEAGVTSIEDLNNNKARFGGEIYGIDSGSTGNDTVKRMISDDYAGLGDWELVPSSEPGMLSQVRKRTGDKEWIAFLGWAPHPMNINHDIKYLSGGAKYWGPNKGEVVVQTVSQKGFAWACPNVGQFLDNYNWTVDEQSLAMNYVRNEDMTPLEAGKRVIRKNPEMLDRWLGRSGIYQTGGIQSSSGETNVKERVSKELGL
jgi:glycine betaine/proline transport system substrate-binding protein